MRHRQLLAQMLLATLLLAVGGVAQPADESPSPWSEPAFSASPAEMLEASSAVHLDEDTHLQILFHGAHYSVDDDGRFDKRIRSVYRLDTASAVDSGWSAVSQHWYPWYQDEPEIRARVITPSGEEYLLDPTDLGEYSEGDDGPDVYGEAKRLKGPLPAVEIGAVIEVERFVHDRKPRFEAGAVRWLSAGDYFPTAEFRLTIEAPTNTPLRYTTHHLPDLEISEAEIDGRTRVTFEGGPFEPWEEETTMAPGDIARGRVIRFSTGESWQAVARGYAEIIDDRVAASDVAEISAKITAGETDRDRIMELVLGFVTDNIRYTGVEFGAQSYIPSTPVETLNRRFGDCKDKATLVVALLQHAGIPAHVALLVTGPDNDVDPELPGIDRFDHAIVYVPGEPAVWIDPTHPFARAGDLPSADEARLTLIAATSTTELVRTPQSSSTENVRHELREVFLSTEGSGRVVETSRVSGWRERSWRSSFTELNESELRDTIEGYATDHYLAEALGDMTISGLENIAQPVVLQLEAKESRRAYTSAIDAAVVIAVGALTNSLPEVLVLQEESVDEDGVDRTFPLFVHRPFVTEIRYEIHAPPGYALASKPDDKERKMGPALLTERYLETEDGVVVADLRFDTGRRLYSAEDVTQFREAIAAFYEEEMPKVSFHQVGETHLEAGRILEAMTEFRSLVERYPSEALYRTQVARAYLAAGLGGNARREARQAVELSSDSAVAQRTLGIVLVHDELGRKFVEGFDPAGAQVALRSAKELNPDDFTSRGELAILLEFDDRGERYGPAADVDGAIAEYKAIRSDLETENLTSNLMAAQLHAGRYEDLRALWGEVSHDATRNALYLAATAMVETPAEAIAEGSRLADDPAEYRAALLAAGSWLINARLYGPAADLMAAGAKGSENSVATLAVAELLRHVRRHESIELTMKTPEGAVLTFLARLMSDSDTDAESVDDLMLPSLIEDVDEEKFVEATDGIRDYIGWVMGRDNYTVDRLLDTLTSLSEISIDGSPNIGYRVRTKLLGGARHVPPMVFFVAPYGHENRVAAPAFVRSMIGKMALDLVEADMIDAAHQWLDWGLEETMTDSVEDALERAPVQWLWSAGETHDIAQVRLASAAMMIDGLYGEFPVSLLNESRDTVSAGDASVGLALALAQAAQAVDRYDLVLESVEGLLEEYPRSSTPFLLKIGALYFLNRYDDMEEALQARAKRFPGEAATRSLLAEVPQDRGDLVEYRRRLAELVESGRATAMEFNNLAWLDIIEDKIAAETLNLAQQSVTMSQYSEAASLHTLATVYAETGQLTEARDVLLALLANRPSHDLESADWYILGRIAEHYHAADAAIEAYSKVEPPIEHEPESTSIHVLATRRLAILQEE